MGKVFSLRSGMSILLLLMAFSVMGQVHGNRLSLGAGALYERGFDATLSVEHETRHHNAWEYFGNAYIKWDEDKSVGHVTYDSFWHNYFTWGLGIAYKPCVVRSRNRFGSLRLGGSLGSDTDEVVGWVNIGYEHNYVLRHGWHLYWQVKTDVCINGRDLFRTGIVLGVKLPVGAR